MNMARQPNTVELVPINRQNWQACAALVLTDEQREFLPSPVCCIAELQFWPSSRGMAIVGNNRIIGLAVFGLEEPSNSWKVFRFMIDTNFQRMGFGFLAMKSVINEVERSAGKVAIRLCYHPRNEGARKLYGSLGFKEVELQPCERSLDGKILAIRPINPT
jgi:diamine N-acetyltransferase